MKLKTRLIYILFYIFALLILILTGDVRAEHISNLWKEFKNILNKSSLATKDRNPD